MPTIDVHNVQGKVVGQMELAAEIFGITPNTHVLHLAVTRQLAAQRLGTHSTKTRSEVRGGGRKPWKQKGTGRARHGSRRSPIWVGGGITFGPTPRQYKLGLPRKVRRLALKSALSAKVQAGEVIILDSLELEAPKTKRMMEMLANINVPGKAMIVLKERNEIVEKSSRNIPGILVEDAFGINVYDILNADKLIMTRSAVEKVQEVLA
jgi:large subunit ribosomal protein L4